MKSLHILFGICLFLSLPNSQAQTAEEIIDNYIENIGGQDAWDEIESVKVTGVGRQQGVDYPFTAYYMMDGRTLIEVDLQGTPFIFEAFDGETRWQMNFQTQKAEASDSETSENYKNEASDYLPSSLFNYEEKGYTAELVGKDTFEGSDVYKIKLTKTPYTVNGEKVENIEMYYMDVDSYAPIAVEKKIASGPAAGMMALTKMSDYQEAGDVYIAYSVAEVFNGVTQLEMIYKNIEINADIDPEIFKMPEE